jgi:hypothetical protein
MASRLESIIENVKKTPYAFNRLSPLLNKFKKQLNEKYGRWNNKNSHKKIYNK